MGVGNDGVAAIDGAMVEVEETLRLAIAHHVTASESVRLTLISFASGSRAFVFNSRLPCAARPR